MNQNLETYLGKVKKVSDTEVTIYWDGGCYLPFSSRCRLKKDKYINQRVAITASLSSQNTKRCGMHPLLTIEKIELIK